VNTYLLRKVVSLQGPILILGASGFIGANLFRCISSERDDVYGTSSKASSWRLKDLKESHHKVIDLLIVSELKKLIESLKPKTVFNCVGYGGYSFQNDTELIYRTNFSLVVDLLEELADSQIASFVNAGSSSEYGRQAAGPLEGVELTPNSHYAISKAAVSGAIHYMGSERGVPCANLRLYSGYGPLEDSSRLVPQLVIRALEGSLPNFVDRTVSRDFIFVDDIVEAFLDTANYLTPKHYGQSFNIGTGQKTTIGEISELARQIFDIKEKPNFKMTNRHWDVSEWYAEPEKAKSVLGWEYRTELKVGLQKTRDWYSSLSKEQKRIFIDSTKKNIEPDSKFSVSVVIACYKDAQAIPIMYDRLTTCLTKMNIDYEIIFINDDSPDNSEALILQLSAKDSRATGISHSRNFGSQAAFRSGMEIATKNAVVILDGDLQDPPELIEQFVAKWREGYDVVYGRRTKREGPWYLNIAYKLFYRLFDRFSYIHIPHDAGDFSLLDIRVVRHLLDFPERDFLLRGLRAFIGFRQIGVDYIRPERMFGHSTNSFLSNIDWARKAIFSYTYTPLTILSMFSFGLCLVTITLICFQVISKILFPEIAPHGFTTLLLVNLGFGSLILLAVSLLGEYIAKIFQEVKKRPHFIRRSILQNGEIRKY